MSELHGQVDDVKGVMNDNIEKILQRGENLQKLEQKTNELDLNVSSMEACILLSRVAFAKSTRVGVFEIFRASHVIEMYKYLC